MPHRCCRRCECSRTHIVLKTSGPITSGEKYRFREPSLGTNAAIPPLSQFCAGIDIFLGSLGLPHSGG